MPAIVVKISRFVDKAQPGWVECILEDATGLAHVFVEKVPVVSAEHLTSASTYPREGRIACEVAEHRDEGGRAVVVVDTEHPWGIESRAGLTRFVLFASQVLGDSTDT